MPVAVCQRHGVELDRVEILGAMKRLLACLVLCASLSAFAQDDNCIVLGVQELASLYSELSASNDLDVFEHQFPATDWELDYWVQIPLCDIAVLTTTNIGSCGGSCYRVYLPDSAPDFHELTVIKHGYFTAGGYVVEETLSNAPYDPQVNYSFVGDNGLDNDGYRGLSRFMFFDGTWYTVGDQQ